MRGGGVKILLRRMYAKSLSVDYTEEDRSELYPQRALGVERLERGNRTGKQSMDRWTAQMLIGSELLGVCGWREQLTRVQPGTRIVGRLDGNKLP